MDDDTTDTAERDRPGQLVNRQEEQTTLENRLTAPGARNLYLYGPRGSGKTHITHAVLNDLSSNYTTCYLSCLNHDTQYKVLKKLCSRLTGVDVGSGYHTAQLKQHIEDTLTDQPTVIVLDELDFVLENDGTDLLYYLSRMEQNHALNLVCISANYPELGTVIDDRTYSSLHPEPVDIEPYSVDQVRRILAETDPDSLSSISVEPHVYGYIASQTQNVRLALHWLQYAADAVEEALTKDRVEETRQSAHQFYWDVLLKDFTPHHHILLEAIDQLSAENGGNVYTGEIYNRYEELCEASGNDTRSQRRLSDYLSHLELLGIIQADYHRGGTKGKTREITLDPELTES